LLLNLVSFLVFFFVAINKKRTSRTVGFWELLHLLLYFVTSSELLLALTLASLIKIWSSLNQVNSVWYEHLQEWLILFLNEWTFFLYSILEKANVSKLSVTMVCCSTTWSAGVQRLAQSYMKNPIQVVIGTLDLAAAHSVTQKIKVVEEEDKFALVCVPSVQDFGRSMCQKWQAVVAEIAKLEQLYLSWIWYIVQILTKSSKTCFRFKFVYGWNCKLQNFNWILV